MEQLKAELRLLSAQYDLIPINEETLEAFLSVLKLFFTERGLLSFSGKEVRVMLRWFVEDGSVHGYQFAVDNLMTRIHLSGMLSRRLPEQSRPIHADNVVSLFKR